MRVGEILIVSDSHCVCGLRTDAANFADYMDQGPTGIMSIECNEFSWEIPAESEWFEKPHVGQSETQSDLKRKNTEL